MKNIVQGQIKFPLTPKNGNIALFRAQKTIKKNMNFQISGQKVNVMKETNYLGMIMEEHLTLKIIWIL